MTRLSIMRPVGARGLPAGPDNQFMYLRAGLVSMGLLLLSRVLGLMRESVQAAAFGSTALADVVVTQLTLPDLSSSILAAGALSYALLPWWARQTDAGLAASQRQASQLFFAVGALLAAWMVLAPAQWGGWLAPGVGAVMQTPLQSALRWAAVAVPLSLLTLVWYTRAQHEGDVVGMYGMNVVHTGVIIAAMLAVGWLHATAPDRAVHWLGVGLLCAFVLRLLFLQARLRGAASSRAGKPAAAPPDPVSGLPPASIWAWALLATGLPAALPLLARSLVSPSAEGALASFNYAWKLLELPNALAIQLVAALVFPALTRAQAEGRVYTVQLRAAFCMAWTLACAGALGLSLAATPISQLLFGWGRMGATHVAEVADWARVGVWMLLPQSVITVALIVLATQQRMFWAAAVYGLALLALGLSGLHQGLQMMWGLAVILAVVALALLAAVGREAWRALAWRDFVVPLGLCPLLGWPGHWLAMQNQWLALAAGALGAMLLIAISYALSPMLRSAVQR
jgi:putative peptidoglycan lipid II flippase